MPAGSDLRERFPGIASIVRNGLFLTGTQWVETLLRAVYVLLIGRLLGPEEYGLWSYVMAAYAFAATSTILGSDFLLSSRLGKNGAQERDLVETTLAVRLALLVVASLVIVGLSLLEVRDGNVRWAFFLVVPAVLGRGTAFWGRPIFTGLEKTQRALQITLAFRSLEVIAGLVLLFLTRDILLLIALHSASWLLEAGFTLRSVRRLTSTITPRFHVDQLTLLWRVARSLGLTAVAVGGMTAAPVLLAKWLGSALAEIGQMGLAIQLAAFVLMACQSFLGASLPVLSRSVGRGDAKAERYAPLVATAIILVFGVLVALASIWGEELIVFLMGARFAEAGGYLAYAIAIAGLSVLPNGYWQLANMRERYWPGLLGALLGFLTIAIAAPAMFEGRGLTGLLTAALAGWFVRAVIIIAAAAGRKQAQ